MQDFSKEVKRYGPVIWGSFFSHGLSDDLVIAVDKFFDIIKDFGINFRNEVWKKRIDEIKRELDHNA